MVGAVVSVVAVTDACVVVCVRCKYAEIVRG